MPEIVFYNPHTEAEIGRWRRSADGSIAPDLSVADILASARNRMGDDEAWAFYASWSNGYVASLEIPDGEEKSLRRWIEALHPRGDGGRFVEALDSGISAVGEKDVRKLKRRLVQQGWEVRRRTKNSKHEVAFPPDRSKPAVTIPGTPGDRRSYANLLAQLRRSGFKDDEE